MFPPAIYPDIKIALPQNPNKLYAVPILGILVKTVMVIPVLLWLVILSLVATLLVWLINPFVVLFTGKYLSAAYDFSRYYIVLYTKLIFFFSGLTDEYPGFSSDAKNFEMDISKPSSPSRLLAIPLLGIFIRSVLIIPFAIFLYIVQYAAYLGVFLFAWFFVLFKGRYPETCFELVRDGTRLSMASACYFYGLSDRYPSFSISWNHKGLKIALLIASTILLVMAIITDSSEEKRYPGPDYFPQSDIQEDYYPAE